MSSDGSGGMDHGHGGMDQGGDMTGGDMTGGGMTGGDMTGGDTMGRRRAQDMSGMSLDPFLDQLCTDISANQEAEIAAMEGWLTDAGVAVATSCEHSQQPLEHMGMIMGCGDATCDSTAAFMHENMAMHEGMAIEFTCDPEIDFVRGMIPHHQGAVTMCEILRDAMSSDGSGGMDHGHGGMDQGGDMTGGDMTGGGMTGGDMTGGDTMGRRRAQDMSGMSLDPFLDQLCTDISANQEAEIAAMEGWLTDAGVAVATSCEHSQQPLEHMGMIMGCGDATCDSTAAFMHENMAMHEGMAIEFTCDPEIDFVRGMIPHHQGAVTMCEILRDAMCSDGSGGMDQGGDMHHGHGDTMGRRRAQDMSSEMGLDSYLDQLCTDISASQEAEIAAMEGWLADKGVAVATSCAHASSGDQAADSEPATCEFEALMAAVQAAIEHGDPSMLADSPYYQSCEEVRPMIERANVVIGATCP